MKNTKLSLASILLSALFFMGASSMVFAGATEYSDKFFQDSIKHMDNLKKCNPSTFSYEAPFFGKSKITIVGRNNGRCQVTSETDIYDTTCNYSDESIAVMTSKQAYQDMEEGKISMSYNSADPDDVANSARLKEECDFFDKDGRIMEMGASSMVYSGGGADNSGSGNSSATAQDDSLIAEQVKQAIMENMQVEASPIQDLGFNKCFSVKAYSIKIITKRVDVTTTQSAIYVKTENGVMEVNKPSMSAELPELLKMIKPNFKLKTEEDGLTMLSAFKALYALNQRNFVKVEPHVVRNGATWNFVIDKFFDKLSGFVAKTDTNGKVVKMSYSLGGIVEK